jgi:DNA-binding NarL/FixJ family response regulator
MASSPVGMEENLGRPTDGEGTGKFIRVIVADTQAIFRAGLRKIFALEDDVRVVGQAETMPQTFSAAKKFSADILLFEAALSTNPVESVSELIKQNPTLRIVVITAEPEEELTLELFRRGAYAIVPREVEPELLIDCLRKVFQGEPWLDSRGIHWVMEAFRSQGARGAGVRAKVQLTPKESAIVSCVTQGMKNKEIAHRVGTTEQVVKNYLRKVYDKLGVADRLELALYCLNNRVVDGQTAVAPNAQASHSEAAPAAAPEDHSSAVAASASAGVPTIPNPNKLS